MDSKMVSFRNTTVSDISSTVGGINTTYSGTRVNNFGAHHDNKHRPLSVRMPEVENVARASFLVPQEINECSTFYSAALRGTSYKEVTERLRVLVEELETTLPRVSAVKDRHTQNTGFINHMKALRMKEFFDMRNKVSEMEIVKREISECKQEIGYFRSISENVAIYYVMAECLNKELSETEKSLRRRLDGLLKREREKGVAAGVVSEYRSVRQRFLETQTELERLKSRKEWNLDHYIRLRAMADGADYGDNMGDSSRCPPAVLDNCNQAPVAIGLNDWTEGSIVLPGEGRKHDLKTEIKANLPVVGSSRDTPCVINPSRARRFRTPSHMTQAVSPPVGRHDPKPPPVMNEKKEGRFRRFFRRVKKAFA